MEFIGLVIYLIANGANVGIGRELFLCSVGQQIDLRNSWTTLDEIPPTIASLTPNVAVSMDQHHYGPNQTTRFEKLKKVHALYLRVSTQISILNTQIQAVQTYEAVCQVKHNFVWTILDPFSFFTFF